MLVNLIGEELAVRGVFYKLVREATHLPLLGLLVSIGFSLWLHAYQGRKNLRFHAVFGLVMCGATEFVGILAPIIFHAMYSSRELKPVKPTRARRSHPRARKYDVSP